MRISPAVLCSFPLALRQRGHYNGSVARAERPALTAVPGIRPANDPIPLRRAPARRVSISAEGRPAVYNPNTILIAGYAKLPGNMTAEAVYETLALVVVADKNTGVILEAEPALVTGVTKRFIGDMLTGCNLNDGCEVFSARLEENYLGNAKKALQTAFRMICTKFEEYKAERTQ